MPVRTHSSPAGAWETADPNGLSCLSAKIQLPQPKFLQSAEVNIYSMDGASVRGEDVALFIDWENFKISLAAGNRTPNVSALKEEVSNYGRVVVAKAYADWVTRSPELKGASQFIIDPPALYAAGIEPVYVPTRLPWGTSYTRTVRVKNSVDVKMTADCIECAHSYPNIGTFVLVSGDSDFIHVVNALRTMGKRVLIIGVSWATSRRLADQVDGLILYDADVDPLIAPEPVPIPIPVPAPVPAPAPVQAPAAAPALAGNGRGAAAAPPTRRELPEVIRAIEEIVRTERQSGRMPLLTSIKQRLMRRFPGFDEKKLGFSGFKKLLLRAAQEGNIKLVTAGLVDWVLMADEPVPAEAATATTEAIEASEGTAAEETEEEVEAGETEAAAPEEFEAEALPQPLAAEVPPVPVAAPPEELAALSKMPDPEIDSAGIELPKGPDDGQDAGRVADIIVMADTLEHQEGISHVAFNFLVSAISQALDEGVKAEHPDIVRRWGQNHSQTYVTKVARSLSNAGLFKHGWHTMKDEVTGQTRRRRTLYLDRDHNLVQRILEVRWGIKAGSDGSSAAPSPVSDTEPVQEDAPALVD
ncbi:MAG: NYN domain-containing protein [SAR202 cluster bacterium]|nr:NYN domain-containing protein [SAR202 cluster bacterium]